MGLNVQLDLLSRILHLSTPFNRLEQNSIRFHQLCVLRMDQLCVLRMALFRRLLTSESKEAFRRLLTFELKKTNRKPFPQSKLVVETS